MRLRRPEAHRPDDSRANGHAKDTARPAAPGEPAAQHKDQGAEPALFGLSMKWVSLIALTVQTSGQALLIRWSRSHSHGGQPYLGSTAVFFVEVLKCLASFALVAVETGGLSEAFACMSCHFTQSRTDLLKAAVPSLIYTVQNNLMFYSLGKLSAPVQQVLYQMKIITTAALGVVMLGKNLSVTQWASCWLLTLGVALVQWPRESTFDDFTFGADHIKGFIAVLCACCTSGFAGVWIQKMLQQKSSASVWVRNVQLGFFGSATSVVVIMVNDGRAVMEGGLLQGYNLRVGCVICMTAFGGLLCAVMLKYAGATHGCFSTALSIILTSILSQTMLGDFNTDILFGIGTTVAVSASLLFSLGLPEWGLTFKRLGLSRCFAWAAV